MSFQAEASQRGAEAAPVPRAFSPSGNEKNKNSRKERRAKSPRSDGVAERLFAPSNPSYGSAVPQRGGALRRHGRISLHASEESCADDF